MGKKAQKRREKKKKKVVKTPKKRNLWIPKIIAGITLAGLALGAINYFPRKKQTTHSVAKRDSFTLKELWEREYLETPMTIEELFKKSKIMRNFRGYNQAPEPVFSETGEKIGSMEKVCKDFFKSPAPNNYSIEAFGILLRGVAPGFAKISRLSARIGPKQINLKELKQRARELRSLSDNEAFPELLNLSYFLTRSNYKSGSVNIHDPELERLMLQGQGDCQTNSYMGLLNFYNLSVEAQKPKLTERVKIMDGADTSSMQTLSGHVWIETDNGILIDYNFHPDDKFFQQSYILREDYLKAMRKLARENYAPLFEIHSKVTDGELRHQIKILVLPKRIQQEIKKTH